MTDDQATLYKVKQGAAWITLNRPDNRNALSAALVTGLYDNLLAANKDNKVRCIVLTGADPAFCAGADLKAVSTGTGNRVGLDGEGPMGPPQEGAPPMDDPMGAAMDQADAQNVADGAEGGQGPGLDPMADMPDPGMDPGMDQAPDDDDQGGAVG